MRERRNYVKLCIYSETEQRFILSLQILASPYQKRSKQKYKSDYEKPMVSLSLVLFLPFSFSHLHRGPIPAAMPARPNCSSRETAPFLSPTPTRCARQLRFRIPRASSRRVLAETPVPLQQRNACGDGESTTELHHHPG